MVFVDGGATVVVDVENDEDNGDLDRVRKLGLLLLLNGLRHVIGETAMENG
jgi:hypothetical protein